MKPFISKSPEVSVFTLASFDEMLHKSKVFQSAHSVTYTFSKGSVRGVCSCGWKSYAYPLHKSFETPMPMTNCVKDCNLHIQNPRQNKVVRYETI